MADQPFSYSGQGFSLQRDKGRFVLPSTFRKTVRESSGNRPVLCLSKHDRWTCLTGFGLSRSEAFADQIDREEEKAAQTGRDFDRDLRAMQLYGFSEVPFDESGRFVLPPHLADLCGVSDQLYFQAAGPFFVLFSPDEFYKMGAGFEGPQAACRQMQAEALKAKKP
jgi:MraZ protein